MSGLRRVLHPILIAAVVFTVLPFALPRFGSAGTLATEIAVYTLYAMGFNLLLGYTGLVSFGASAFFGTASYAAGLASVKHFCVLANHTSSCMLLTRADIRSRSSWTSPSRRSRSSSAALCSSSRSLR